jgi:hypothetical protein
LSETVEVQAWRAAPWWALEVPGVGVTQVRWLADAQWMARDLIACVRDVDPDQVGAVRVSVGIGPTRDPGSRSPWVWVSATVDGLRDRVRRIRDELTDRTG